MKWRGLWGQCPHGFVNCDGSVTWQRHLQWPFTHATRWGRDPITGRRWFSMYMGHVQVTVDSRGVEFEGGLWPVNNYRVTACGDAAYDMAPACERCSQPDSYCSRNGLNKPGMPYVEGEHGGYYVWRDHSLGISWGLRRYACILQAVAHDGADHDVAWRFSVTLPYVAFDAY